MNPIYFDYELRRRNYNLSPISFIPTLIAPNEKFVEITDYMIPNVIPHFLVSNYGRIYDIYNSKFVAVWENKVTGYWAVTLPILGREYQSINIYIHRLVLLGFNYIENSELYEANHIKGIKSKNTIWDLEWTTHQQNINHAIINNLTGSNSSISESVIEDICKRLENGESVTNIADNLNIKKGIVQSIKSKNNHKKISIKYRIPDVRKNEYINSTIVEEICKRLENNESVVNIAKDLQISRNHIDNIKAGKGYINISKKYNISGTKNINNELDEKIVREICSMIQNHIPSIYIANKLNIPVYIVANIKQRKNFISISKEYKFPKLKESNCKISNEIVEQICQKLQLGIGMSTITKELQVPYYIVDNIKRRKNFTSISKNFRW